MRAVPIERMVKRHVCPFCHAGRSKRPTAQAHVDQCWKSLEHRKRRSTT